MGQGTIAVVGAGNTGASWAGLFAAHVRPDLIIGWLPDQANLLIQLVVLAVYDALTHQPFNPPAQYAPQAQQAQDVVTAYQGQS